MLAIWSTGHVQVFKLAALIPLITAVGNGRGVGGDVRGIQHVAKVEAAACVHNDWPALWDSHKLPDKLAWPGSSLQWYTLHQVCGWQHPGLPACFKEAAITALKESRWCSYWNGAAVFWLITVETRCRAMSETEMLGVSLLSTCLLHC